MRHFLSSACAACSALLLLAGCEKPQPPKPVKAPLAVKTMTVELSDQPQWIKLLGRTEGGQEVEVKAQASGVLQSVGFTEGAPVQAGDVIYKIDPAPFEAKLNAAQANVKSARAATNEAYAAFTRTKKLYSVGARSQQDYDAAKRLYDVANAALQSAIANERDASITLGYTDVKAPTTGYISRTNLNPGALVSAQNTVLATITQHDDLRVVFAPSARTLGTATITTDNAVKLLDEHGHELDAKLDFVSQSLTSAANTRPMRAKLLNNPGLLPGDFVHVNLQIGTHRNVARIPQSAVRQQPDGTYTVYLLKDGKAVLQPVKLDRWDGPDWIATEGLKTGDQIITNQLLKLRNGLKVTLDDAKKSAKH